MKSNRNTGLLVLAVAGLAGAAGVVSAQTTAPAAAATTATTTTAPDSGGHRWHGHRGGLLGITLRATRQLNLTADQQASIKTILSNARAQAKAAHAANQSALDIAVLGNPGDPNYAAALQSAKTRAASRVETESELQGQIYNVLTAEQKAQLPTVLADMKAKVQQHRAAWEQRHSTSSSAG